MNSELRLLMLLMNSLPKKLRTLLILKKELINLMLNSPNSEDKSVLLPSI